MKTDVCLVRLVMDELDWDPSVDVTRIGITCQEGIVTLNGEVPVYSEKLAAEEVAKRVHGVREVINRIEVIPAEGHRRLDEELFEAATRALEWDAGVPQDRVQVEVDNSWITLEGTVTRKCERDAAERAVRHLLGSRGLTNRIDVVAGEGFAYDPQAVAEAIARNAALRRFPIAVTVDGDRVILEGDVHTVQEREEAERIAWHCRGVRQVENCITVTPWGSGPCEEWGY